MPGCFSDGYDGLKLIHMDWNGFRWIETDTDGMKRVQMDGFRCNQMFGI